MSTKAEDTQKNILDTARKHFLKDGLTGASLRNIVKDAGLTTGAFYKYYPTKEALFDALTDPYMEHIYQIYDQIVEEFEKLSASDQTMVENCIELFCKENLSEQNRLVKLQKASAEWKLNTREK